MEDTTEILEFFKLVLGNLFLLALAGYVIEKFYEIFEALSASSLARYYFNLTCKYLLVFVGLVKEFNIIMKKAFLVILACTIITCICSGKIHLFYYDEYQLFYTDAMYIICINSWLFYELEIQFFKFKLYSICPESYHYK